VSTPGAYLVPAELAEALVRHGIEFEPLVGERALNVESYEVLSIEKTDSPDVAGVVPPPGGAEVPLSADPPRRRFETVLSVRTERRRMEVPSGMLVVRTNQRAGTLAVYLLEPCSDDGFARWEMLDAWLRVGELYPIHRVLRFEDA
jgi:hypothetical protein